MSPAVSKARSRPAFRCTECGWEAAKWVGRCGECQAWGSVAEAAAPTTRATAGPVSAAAVPIGQVSVEDSSFRASGVPELDRVLGGGLVPGAAILLAGEPAIAAALSMSPARSRRPRSGCGPTAPTACTTSSTSPPRTTSVRC